MRRSLKCRYRSADPDRGSLKPSPSPVRGSPRARRSAFRIPFRVEGGGAAVPGYAQSPARKRDLRWAGLQDPRSSRTNRALAVGQCCQGDNAGHAGKSGEAA